MYSASFINNSRIYTSINANNSHYICSLIVSPYIQDTRYDNWQRQLIHSSVELVLRHIQQTIRLVIDTNKTFEQLGHAASTDLAVPWRRRAQKRRQRFLLRVGRDLGGESDRASSQNGIRNMTAEKFQEIQPRNLCILASSSFMVSYYVGLMRAILLPGVAQIVIISWTNSWRRSLETIGDSKLPTPPPPLPPVSSQPAWRSFLFDFKNEG